MNLPNRVDLYHHTPTKSASTGAAIVGTGTEYPSPYASAVPSSVQPKKGAGPRGQDYIAGTTDWDVYFDRDPGVNPNDMIVWTDNSGMTRYLVNGLVRDAAGRGIVWVAECYERLAS